MRFRTIAIAAALSSGLAGLSQTSNAFAPHKGAETTVAAGRSARVHRDVTWRAPQGALSSLPGWRVIWDRDTDVPLRLWGAPIAAPGTNASAVTAEAAARKFLAEHLDVLAPGSEPGDFTLLANDLSGSLRTVTFAQHARGFRVLGGAVAFTFSHDNLISIASTAIPDVAAHIRLPGGVLPLAQRASSAKTWLAQDGHHVDVKEYGERVIVPVVHPRGRAASTSIAYHVADTVIVESSRVAGRWEVWLDANNASPVARRSTLMFASGKVLFDTPDRYPGGVRTAKPAPEATHQLAVGAAAATPVTSLMDGTITWADSSTVTVTTGLIGPKVRIQNEGGALASDEFQLAPNGMVTWSKATDEYGDAQLTAFVATSTAKQFAKTRLPASTQLIQWLDSRIDVSVNEQQTCNAFSTGDDIHFFMASNQCENTGRITDVVFHEFGHSVHAQSIIEGIGAFDSSLSEGLADTLAASITGDHGMGRGFFFSDQPLRDLDPVGFEKRWPDDADGEPHDEGEIIAETLWDLRSNLENKYGQAEGFEKFLHIYYGVMQRSSDIPSTYAEALVVDDDDGNLENGTPNQCTIAEAFGRHGLVDPTVTLGIEPPVREGYKISVTARSGTGLAECPPPTVASGTLTWKAQGGTTADIDLAASGDTWSGNIPTQADGTVVLYHIKLVLSDGSTLSYPQNPADPDYQFYAGNVQQIWCADFEDGIGEWTAGGTLNRQEWEAGAPMGLAGDPTAAHGGTGVLGTDLGTTGNMDGFYRSRAMQYVESPEIDLQGNTSVRLQYWRWLNVEDAIYDQATISANGSVVWTNFASANENAQGVTHTDKEWRFQDVDLSTQTSTGKIKLRFGLDSDQGLEFGGWTIDDVCLVTAGPPSSTCGNNNVDEGETCDDGNDVDGDGCSSTCGLDGDNGGEDGGCCSAGTNPAGAFALSFLTIGLVIRRRRRRAA